MRVLSRFVYAPDGQLLGEYGTNAQAVRAEFVWLLPQVDNNGQVGDNDGLSGYMPLARPNRRGGSHIAEFEHVYNTSKFNYLT